MLDHLGDCLAKVLVVLDEWGDNHRLDPGVYRLWQISNDKVLGVSLRHWALPLSFEWKWDRNEGEYVRVLTMGPFYLLF